MSCDTIFRQAVTEVALTVRVQLIDKESTPIDISAASSARMYFLTPDDQVFTVETPKVVITDALSGILEYNHSDGDFPLRPGVYLFAGAVVWPDGRESIGTNHGSFRVKELFEK